MSYSKQIYADEIKDSLKRMFGFRNDMIVPKLDKIVLNCTSAEMAHDSKVLATVVEEISLIAGQKPVVTKAKQSIAGFKLREGMNLGVKVTLRKDKMFEFLDRLVYVALPKVRDFSGLSSRGFDGKGNFSMGIKEQIVFPEIDYDKISRVRGFDVTICTTAKTDKEALALLRAFKLPYTS